jgi:hypothetical protein
MRNYAIGLGCLLLAACGSVRTVTVKEPVEVRVPVVVPCEVNVPSQPLPIHGDLSGYNEHLRAVLSTVEILMVENKSLRDAIEACR